ncbi:uncharacterized protein [Chironomus tepperi]|uniref:uncharacterized protein n=1 Tax=Chironomus tepperi TaxID=113505 RepID=UPI00391FC85A
MKFFWFIICLLFPLIERLSSLNIECEYASAYFEAVGDLYYCDSKYDLDIFSRQSANIDEVTGKHALGKAGKDIGAVYFLNKTVKYFPQGMDKLFPNLRAIAIWGGGTKEIHQTDLKPFIKLVHFILHECEIEVLEDGLFHFNPKLKYISFHGNKIFHIHPNVFDNLKNLSWLYLGSNKCINNASENSTKSVNSLIPVVKNKCKSSEFMNLDEHLKKLEAGVEKGEIKNFKGEFAEFKTKFVSSGFKDSYTLGSRFDKVNDYLTGLNEKIYWTLLDKVEALDNKIEKITKGMNAGEF